MSGPKLKLDDVPRFEALVDALKRAYRAYKRGQYGIRDLALVSILVYTGCRLSEALALTVHDIENPISFIVEILSTNIFSSSITLCVNPATTVLKPVLVINETKSLRPFRESKG